MSKTIKHHLPKTGKASLVWGVVAFATMYQMPEVYGLDFERGDKLVQPGFYVAGSVGQAKIEEENYLDENDDLKDDRTIISGFLGVRANDYVSVELGYSDFNEIEQGNFVFSADGITAAIMLSLPVHERLSIYAGGGYLQWEVESELNSLGVTLKSSSDGSDNFGLAGVALHLNEHLDIRVDYREYDLEDVDVDVASLGIQLNF